METFNVELPDGRILEGVPVGTTKAQISEKLGLSFDEPKGQESGVFDTVMDNFAQGALLGGADEAQAALAAGIMKMGGDGRSFGDLYDKGVNIKRQQLDKQMEDNPLLAGGTQIASTIGTGLVGAGTKAGKALLTRIGSGGAGRRIAKGAGAGSVSGGVAGFASGEGGAQDRAQSAGVGAILGGGVGGAIPGAGAAIRGVKDAITPAISDAIKPLAQRAKDFEIPLRLDQVAPSKVRDGLQKVSQEIPFNGVDAFEETQRKAWNKQLAKTIGMDADDLSPATIKQFMKESNKAFSTAASGKTLTVNKPLVDSIKGVVDEAKNTISPDLASIVERNAKVLAKGLESGNISGDKLTSIRGQLIKRLPNVNADAKPYVSDLVSVIDEAIEPLLEEGQKQTLREARYHWRNYKTIQPLLEKSKDGMVNPTQLLQRVKSNKYINADRLEVGEDDIVDLARIGSQFMPIKGGSDTFQKASLLGQGGLVLNAILNPVAGVPLLTKAGAGVAGNRAMQSIYNQSPKMIDRALNKQAPQAIGLGRRNIDSATGLIGSSQVAQ